MNALFNKLLSLRQIEYLALDRDLHILEASVGVQRFAEYPSEATLGKHICLSFPELIGIENILITILEGRQASFELKGISRSSAKGKPLYLDLYIVNTIQQENSSKNQLIIFFEDVTERMALEQKLVQRANEVTLLLEAWDSSNEYLNKVIQSIADTLLVTNKFGIIKMINQAAKKLFEYNEEELIGKQLSQIIQEYNLLLKAGQHYLVSEEVMPNIAVVGLTKQGKKVAIAFSCSAIHTNLDSVPDFIYVGREITQR